MLTAAGSAETQAPQGLTAGKAGFAGTKKGADYLQKGADYLQKGADYFHAIHATPSTATLPESGFRLIRS
jgi:hypothetical protein